MRTTLTLEDEVAERLKETSELEGKSFKEVVNNALKRGLGLEKPAKRRLFRVKAHSSPFHPGLDLRRLNQLADTLEIEDFAAKAAGATK